MRNYQRKVKNYRTRVKKSVSDIRRVFTYSCENQKFKKICLFWRSYSFRLFGRFCVSAVLFYLAISVQSVREVSLSACQSGFSKKFRLEAKNSGIQPW